MFGKSFHLPVKLEYKALWALKRLNLNWSEATKLRLEQINEMDEFRLWAYESSALYKEKMKLYHDRRIENREFHAGDLVLLYNSKLRLFAGKLKSKRSGPFTVIRVFSHGSIELNGADNVLFKVNGQRVKHYVGVPEEIRTIEELELDEV